jgi:hypothetical protein
MGQKWYQSTAYDLPLFRWDFYLFKGSLLAKKHKHVFSFNPLTAGIGRISPGLFLNCPYKKPVILKMWKKYVFLGKCISYHSSLGDCFEKFRFHVVLGIGGHLVRYP